MRSTAGDARMAPIKNLFMNPNGASTGNRWGFYPGPGGAATKSVYVESSENVVRLTWNTGSSGGAGGGYIVGNSGSPNANRMWVTTKKPLYTSVLVRPSVSMVIQPKIEYYDSAATPNRLLVVTGSSITCAPGTWTLVWLKTPDNPVAGTTTAVPTFYSTRTFTAGEYIEYKQPLLVQENGYFQWTSGDTQGWKWLGTVNDSESVGYPKPFYPWPNMLTKVQSTVEGSGTLHTAGVFQGNSLSLVREASWSDGGTASLRLNPAGSTSDCHVNPGNPGDLGGLRNGMLPGKTYTVSGTAYWPEAPGGTLEGGTRTGAIRVFTRIGAAGHVETGTGINLSPGVTRRTHTFTVPADANTAFIRFYCGSTATPIYWDRLGLFEHNEYGAPPVDYWVPGTT